MCWSSKVIDIDIERYICMYACTCMYICMYVCVCLCVCVCVCVFCVCVCVCVCIRFVIDGHLAVFTTYDPIHGHEPVMRADIDLGKSRCGHNSFVL